MDTIKLTPLELVDSWNALGEVIEVNDNPEFTSQAKRLQMQVRDNVVFWNELSKNEREAIAGEQIEIPATKITKPPRLYSNDYIESLSRFMDCELPEKEPALKKALSSKDK